MKKITSTRRQFVRNSSLGLAAAGIGISNDLVTRPKPDRLPREVWVGTVAMAGLSAETAKEMTIKVLQVMEDMVPYQPDIICLPECFAYSGIREPFEIKDVAEKAPGWVVRSFMKFAKQHQCYIICPTYIRDQGNVFIAAVLIERNGQFAGQYHKMRPADSEMAAGVKPGAMDPPVFDTDFGKIGIQICFDLKWEEGWQKLKAGGAEIIFWPSAYAGGRELCSRAWRHQVYIVSSTQKDSSRICDLSGEVIAQTNRWQAHWTCAPLNLEKTFLHAWPAVSAFPEIQKKYGRKVKLTTYAEEEWTILESLDPGVKVKEILAEFNLPTHEELLQKSALRQEGTR